MGCAASLITSCREGVILTDNKKRNPKKKRLLKDMNLVDRFLFTRTIEDPEAYEALVWKGKNQVYIQDAVL